jgi:hypothetical protein
MPIIVILPEQLRKILGQKNKKLDKNYICVCGGGGVLGKRGERVGCIKVGLRCFKKTDESILTEKWRIKLIHTFLIKSLTSLHKNVT